MFLFSYIIFIWEIFLSESTLLVYILVIIKIRAERLRGKNCQLVYKPDSVPLRAMTIPLGQMFPFASSDQPEPQIWKSIQRDSYLVLLPVGFAIPVCYQTSGALLPHRFILTEARRFGGLFSVALSVRLPCPGITRHRISVKSGLSSPAN